MDVASNITIEGENTDRDFIPPSERPILRKPIYKIDSSFDDKLNERNRSVTLRTDDSCADSCASSCIEDSLSLISVDERCTQSRTPLRTLETDAIATNSPTLIDVALASSETIGKETVGCDFIPISEVNKGQVSEINSQNESINNIIASDTDNSIIESSTDDHIVISPSDSEASLLFSNNSTSRMLKTSNIIGLQNTTEDSRYLIGLSDLSTYNNTLQSLPHNSSGSLGSRVPSEDYQNTCFENTASEFDDSDRDEIYIPYPYESSVESIQKEDESFQAEDEAIFTKKDTELHISPKTVLEESQESTPRSEEAETVREQPSIQKSTRTRSKDLIPSNNTLQSLPRNSSGSSRVIPSEDNHNTDFEDTASEFDDSDRDETYRPYPYESSVESIQEEDEAIFTETALEECQEPTPRSEEAGTVREQPEKQKPKRIRSKDFCYFCEKEILNFARHIMRNHLYEPEVQQIVSFPKKSYTRKNLFATLRKKGNYFVNIAECTRPMKKSLLSEYLPCNKCLGFYSRKQLWKHRKTCDPSVGTSQSKAQSEAQNFLLRCLNVDQKLKEDVFPTMRPDRVSLEAKKDPLICAFGAQYMRIHREKHFVNVTSRKMRELAKLAIEMKTLKSSLKNLMDCLKPENYDLIVTATKNVSNYDHQKDRYGAPTYAMNISTSLKQCCNIAIMETLKNGNSVANATLEADFKTLIQLIDANWKFDVSSQANSDLNLNKWNKITIVPLASDLKQLKDYLCVTSTSAIEQLKSERGDVVAFKTLQETIFCRIILLNRRRPGELQRLLLSSYKECNRDINAYEEFNSAISSTEKLLVKSFKRMVIRGKRGRGVPVLFTDDVQKDIDLLLSVRHKNVADTNDFLFAKAGFQTPLCGYKVLEKHAKLSGAKNPKAITSTKLRKHLATLSQMFNLKDSDIEQLANFMGHTESVHRQNYRLPDDIYQTAKISKLLLLMESGNADKFKGKALDEIDLDLEQDLLQEVENREDEENNYEDYQMEHDEVDEPDKPVSEFTSEPRDEANNVKPEKRKKRNLVPWTSQQKKIVKDFFNRHIKSKRPPKRHECEELRNEYPDILNNKDWLKIKVFVQNIYKKK